MEGSMPRSLSPTRGLLLGVALLVSLALPASVLAATIDGTNGNDVLFGTSGADTINGLGGNDLVYGARGDDTIGGGLGNDALFGGPGADSLSGEDGTDVLVGGLGVDLLDGGSGNDYIFASGDATSDTISCGPGEDSVWLGPTDLMTDGSCEHTFLLQS
jgi:Hemolysin-type calcium-binding repeat (2 copies).